MLVTDTIGNHAQKMVVYCDCILHKYCVVVCEAKGRVGKEWFHEKSQACADIFKTSDVSKI